MTKDSPEKIHFGKMNMKQFYERENSQFNRNQAHSNTRPTLQQETKSYNTARKQPFNQRFPRENSFRQNEDAAKQFYERENSQFIRNQAHSNTRPTSQQDTKSYNTQNENNVRWIQQEENNVDYCDAISDLFPLN